MQVRLTQVRHLTQVPLLQVRRLQVLTRRPMLGRRQDRNQDRPPVRPQGLLWEGSM